MARRTGRAPRPVERPETAPDDDASAWARFLRLLTERETQDAEAETEGALARFLRRLASDGDHPDSSSSGKP